MKIKNHYSFQLCRELRDEDYGRGLLIYLLLLLKTFAERESKCMTTKEARRESCYWASQHLRLATKLD